MASDLRSTLIPSFYHEKVTPVLLVATVTGSTILSTYFSGFLTIALPTIGQQLGLKGENVQWPLTITSLLNGSFLLIGGALADTFGKRALFLSGILLMFAVSISAAFVTSSISFNICAGLIGLANALITPSATGVLAALPDGRFRDTAYSALGSGQPVGYTVGLLVGGFTATRWPLAFFIMAGGAFIFCLLAVLAFPQDFRVITSGSTELLDASVWRQSMAKLARFDWVGAIFSTSGLVMLTFALADAGSSQQGWRTPIVPALLPPAFAALCGFAWWEKRIERSYLASQTRINALLPPSIFAAKSFKPLLASIFVAWLSFNTLSFYATLFIQDVQALPPIDAAIRFLPMVISGLGYNLVTGLLMSRVSASWLFFVGTLGGAMSCVVFCISQESSSYWSSMFVVFLLITTTDLIFPPAQIYAAYCVGPSKAALAGALFNTTVRLATSIGLALSSTIASIASDAYRKHHVSASDSQVLLQGYHAAAWFCMGASLSAMILSMIWLRSMGVVGSERAQREAVEEAAVQRRNTFALRFRSALDRRDRSGSRGDIRMQPLEKAKTRDSRAMPAVPVALDVMPEHSPQRLTS